MAHAQTQQIFIYMLTVIVVGLLLLVGANSIFKIVDRMKQVDIVTFKTSLEQEASTYRNYGRWKNLEIPVPGSITEVCFVDLSQDAPPQGDVFCDTHPLICNAWRDNTQNVFTEPFILDTPVHLGDINIKDVDDSQQSYICLPVVGGMLRVTFAGGARGKLQISPYVP